MNNGLTSATNYPFTESSGGHRREACLLSTGDVYPAVAGITGYTDVNSYDEPAILYPVSSGAVSIGICANDDEFMFYSSGILSFDSCCVQINHAVVIVGYGYDNLTNLDYWIIQNSW